MRTMLIAAAALALSLGAAGQAAAQGTGASLESRLADYRHRVELLKDKDAVENLQAAYGFYVDKMLWREVADLFAANGSFEFGQMGVYVGKPHIQRALLLFGKEGPEYGKLNNYMQLQSVIHVAPDGRTAKARWQGVQMTGRKNESGQWGLGVYENEYVKEGGVWKISKLHFYFTAATDYDLGWMKSAIPAPGQSGAVPPDKPPTEVYRAYPGVYVPPFDYNHPVTGEPIVIPEPADPIVGRE